jgi:ketosteroid isomerase-like protein
VKADPKTERGILGMLKAFSDHFSVRDIDGMLSLFSHGSEVVMVGSEEWEMGTGYSSLRPIFTRLFTRPEAQRWEWKLRSVATTGSVAWVFATAEVRTKLGRRETVTPYRLSAVLEKKGDGWLFVLFNGSEPFPSKE